MLPGKGGIGGIPVALRDAGEVRGQNVAEAFGRPAGFPVEDDVPVRNRTGPEVTLAGPAAAGIKVVDRRLIGEVTSS